MNVHIYSSSRLIVNFEGRLKATEKKPSVESSEKYHWVGHKSGGAYSKINALMLMPSPNGLVLPVWESRFHSIPSLVVIDCVKP